eukprot:COSAG02_NODE_65918_length_256_cov_14711.643312_1_plen_66_part_10
MINRCATDIVQTDMITRIRSLYGTRSCDLASHFGALWLLFSPNARALVYGAPHAAAEKLLVSPRAA